MMWTFFIHLNHGRETFNFLSALGRELEKKHNVIYILESELCFKMYSYFFDGRTYEIWPNCDEIVSNEYSNLNKDINYWEYLYPDIDRENWIGNNSGRKLDWYRSYISVSLNWLEFIFNKYDVKAVIYEQFTTAPAFLLGEVAKKRGIKYFGLQQSRIPGRFEIHEGKYSFIDLVTEKYQNIKKTGVTQSLKEQYLEVLRYKKNLINIEPSYMKPASYYIGSLTEILKSNFLSKVCFFIKNYKLRSYQVPSPLSYSYNRLKNKVKKIKNYKYYLRLTSCPEIEKYMVYPLQYHPEASTSVYAKNFDDELNTIKNIAYNLPMDFILYVKEHRAALGIRSKRFYKEIAKLPNVKLIKHDVNTKELIKNSKGVITLTSTVGYEAIILGKPVIVLGRVFYEQAYGVYRPKKWEDIFSIIKNKVNNFVSNDEEVVKFLLAYWLSTYEGNVFVDGAEEINNIRKVTNIIEELLRNE